MARDLQQVVLYDADGVFVGVRRPGSGKPIIVEGQTLVVESLKGASGIQLKHDPGVVYVYTGFGFLMITTLLSYISHSQVRALVMQAVQVVGSTTLCIHCFYDFVRVVLQWLPCWSGSVGWDAKKRGTVQVWALQEGGDVHVGGKSNRAVVAFAAELEEVLEAMPERLLPSPATDKPAVKAAADNRSG